MKPASPSFPCHRPTIAVLLLSLLVAAVITKASVSGPENGVRWLQAEFPANVTLPNADCAQLAAAVGKATLAHPHDAPAILRVALTRGIRKLARNEEKLPCACATRLLSISVAAAPAQASALLDLATELYPDCAAELAGVLRDYDQVAYDAKDGVDDKNVVANRNAPAFGAAGASDPTSGQSSTDDPATAIQDPGDLSERDITGLGFGGTNGFGPGFPGAPGFAGSTPSGGIALPPTPVTAAVNG